ncbi:MAG TPA: hypothetical protein VNQ90_00065 [Chthoniobacteraceae bacterium]|nr:hypothetical protein [Chthoniobacteraceae bacterium]
MIRIRTHVVNHHWSANHRTCARCGMEIPPLKSGSPLLLGDLVGVIETTVIPPSSYRVGENDSNRRCYEE